jgi:D-alanine transaminase
MAIGFFNGEFIPVEQQVVPIDERGHNFGDGIYEVIKVYNGEPFLMREHLERMDASAKAIRLEMPYTIEELEGLIREGVQRSGLPNCDVYIQITRGIATRLHAFPKDTPAAVAMTIRESRPVPPQYWEDGIGIMLLVDERWVNCYIKSLNLLPNILAKQTASDNGYYEAVFFRDGFITEGSSTNAFAIKDGKLYTTPATKRILHGITRTAVLKLANELNVPVVEEDFTPQFLVDADEAFITSTSIEVMPITNVEGKKIADGKPGPITRQLQAAYRALYAKQTV